MAHLEVEPKPSRPWWVWLLIVLLVILLAGLLMSKCNNESTTADPDTIAADNTRTPIAKTAPDWASIDFNSATQTDADITDADIQTRSSGTYTIYSLGENILFPTAGNDLSENGVQKLRMIADVLNKRFEGATIGVFGSTDSTGPADENKELGKERAATVRNWLTEKGSVPADNVSVQSLGETEPVATNETKAGRQQNRNVSIVVFPKQ
ncbi:OmpA family protein [Pedobacter frigoris]|uniref:OmpA family protein n=1 Tax=Pedobacter frigoris TaxID=2571272 RepID=A0A4U1CM37_9SPHI|nr:OmpA family protein [Pedobacter frigoris]TKC07586.1 OmpA family protein [Pedobacter frigoris]